MMHGLVCFLTLCGSFLVDVILHFRLCVREMGGGGEEGDVETFCEQLAEEEESTDVIRKIKRTYTASIVSSHRQGESML